MMPKRCAWCLAVVGALLLPSVALAKAPSNHGPSWLRSIYVAGNPTGVAVSPSGKVFVAVGNRVVVYSSSGRELFTLSAAGRYPFQSLFGLTVDPVKHRLYVPDYNAQAVWVFNTQGKFLFYFPHVDTPSEARPYLGHVFHPYDVAIYGDRLYVAASNAVYIFTAKGQLLQRWGKPNTFNFANGIAADAAMGRIYVADSLNQRIWALRPDGRVVWKVGIPNTTGANRSFFLLPRGIAVGPKHVIYVADTLRDRIYALAPNGTLLGYVGSGGAGDGQLNLPYGISVFYPQLRKGLVDYLRSLWSNPGLDILAVILTAVLIYRLWRGSESRHKAAWTATTLAGMALLVAFLSDLIGGSSGLYPLLPTVWVADNQNQRVDVFNLKYLWEPSSESEYAYKANEFHSQEVIPVTLVTPEEIRGVAKSKELK